MPSHSKKQHNFMEAVAHSPSFAKKAGVPQSVGKDYAAADKGKTFKRGGEMKESMTNKEVAFFKKKGAPASMIKHEKAEMKGMKAGGKVRRMANGGAAGYLDSLENEDYETRKEQGAKNLKSFKNFLGLGEQEPAPIEERKSRSSAPATSGSVEKLSWSGSGDSDSAKPANLAQRPVFTGMGTFEDNAEPQRNQALEDAQEQGRRAMAAFKPVKNAKPANKETKRSEEAINISTGASGFPSRYSSDREAKNKAEIERLKKEGSGAVESTVSPVETMLGLGALRAPAMVRAGIGAARKAYDYFTSPKTEAKTESLKDKTVNEINAQRAADKDARGAIPTKSGAIQPKGTGPSEAGRELMQGAGRGKPQSLKDKTVEEINAQRAATKDVRGNVGSKSGAIKPTGKGPSEAGKKLMDRTNKRSSTIMDKERQPGFMQKDIAGRDVTRKRAQEDEGFSTPRHEFKKGGQMKSYAQGGFTREADGVAQKGKTQGKMVKMASGGFVRSADGCAQRGKTRAAQVKMSRGGKC
jgi:hypothetical protein